MAYDGTDGRFLSEEQCEVPDMSLNEVFYTDDYRIEAPLHDVAQVYDIQSGKKLYELNEDAYLIYVTQAGDYIVTHPGIDMISFTGGTKTGEHIAKMSHLIPLVMELGGKDPAIVLENANLDLTVKNIVSGAFSYSGQRCTAIKRVFVEEKIADKLVLKLQEEIEKISVGSPEDNSVVVPLIDKKSADFVQELIEDALNKNALLVTGNRREEQLIYPTLLDYVTTDMKVAWEEPFGPILPIIRVKNVEEAIELSNQSQYGLQASIFTQDIDKAFQIASRLEVGSVQINGRTERGPDHFPFLGVKGSGLGVQGIPGSLHSMTREKMTIININH